MGGSQSTHSVRVFEALGNNGKLLSSMERLLSLNRADYAIANLKSVSRVGVVTTD